MLVQSCLIKLDFRNNSNKYTITEEMDLDKLDKKTLLFRSIVYCVNKGRGGEVKHKDRTCKSFHYPHKSKSLHHYESLPWALQLKAELCDFKKVR